MHDYEQDPATFASHYDTLGASNTFDFLTAFSKEQIPYNNKKPFFISEYGGIGWSVDSNAWGYGNTPASPEEFLQRLKGLTDVLLDNDKMFGFCYTQLTDVEIEQNGLYTYDRQPKFSPEKIHPILSRKAAIEK